VASKCERSNGIRRLLLQRDREETERERFSRDTLQFVFFAPLPFLTSTARSSSSSPLFTSSVDSSVPRKDVLKRASEQ
jgi:hypothetical protein